MRQFASVRYFIVAAILTCCQVLAQDRPATQPSHQAVIWEDPGDIRSRNLFYGPGGKKDEPHGPLTFVKEDMHGHNPKFDVEDEDGKKWRAKMGPESQAEPVASRLLWAVGYFSNENYFVHDLQVKKLPPHLKRGQSFVVLPDHVKDVRLQRHPRHEKKAGNWNWKHNPFVGTRELNGLRVMMALIGNWDLNDDNNAIYEDENGSGEQFYEVTDVGTAFGPAGPRYRDKGSKNNFRAYRKTKFISKVTPEYVDFSFPHLPPLLHIFSIPVYAHNISIHWIGRHIPRADAKWIGSLLAQLTPEQIRDAFRAGGYSPEQVEAFAAVVEKRINELKQL